MKTFLIHAYIRIAIIPIFILWIPMLYAGGDKIEFSTAFAVVKDPAAFLEEIQMR